MLPRRPVGLLTAALVLAAMAGPAGADANRAASPGRADPVDLVDPFVGTGVGGPQVGAINTFPGADAPFGMLQWSPDTAPTRAYGGGYRAGQPRTVGLSLTHLSGPGCPGLGDVPILPYVGAVGSDPNSLTDGLEHRRESASPGYYAATLQPGAVRMQVTVTPRTGIATLTFPPTSAADVIVKAGDSEFPDAAATVRVVGDHEVVGSVSDAAFCLMPDHYTAYFAIIFDRPFRAASTYGVSGVTPATAGTTAASPRTGAVVSFDTRRARVLRMKVGLSYVSVAGALDNLRREQPGGFSFGDVHAAVRAAWARVLDRIRVGGGTHEQQVTFYTAMYHAFLHPNVFSDANGRYMGFDGHVHQLAHGSQFANFSGWDTYRCTVQLQALLEPDLVSQMVSSLLRDAAQGGGLPKWEFNNSETSVMNGDSADPVIADAWAFGARQFDLRTALADMVRGATRPVLVQHVSFERPELGPYQSRGYVPTVVPNPTSLGVWNTTSEWWGSSETLEYALDDFAISRLAAALDEPAVAVWMQRRAQNWQQVLDPGQRTAAARGVDGAFAPGGPFLTEVPAYGQAGFEEGNGAQYTWEVPQDVGGLIAALGGDRAARRLLDRLFRRLNAGPAAPEYWAGNEPSLGTPYVYDWAGAPWETQRVVRRIVATLYSDTPGGEPGNDDLGALSASYVWDALGMYPATPGTGVLALGSPLFPRVLVHLGDGRTLRILAPRAAVDRPYVWLLTVAGRPWPAPWLPLSVLRAGTTLVYSVSDRPDRSWGAAPGLAPPSFLVGAAPALGFTVPTGALTVAPAATVTVRVGVQAVDPRAQSVRWTASATGVLLRPASGVLRLGPGTADTSARSSVALALTAAAPGRYVVRFSFVEPDGAVLPPMTLDVLVD